MLHVMSMLCLALMFLLVGVSQRNVRRSRLTFYFRRVTEDPTSSVDSRCTNRVGRSDVPPSLLLLFIFPSRMPCSKLNLEISWEALEAWGLG